MEELKKGTIVYLNSGSPPMTVRNNNVNVDSLEGDINCSWFDGNGLHEGNFAKEQLTTEEKRINIKSAY